jgi:hypothetical protein
MEFYPHDTTISSLNPLQCCACGGKKKQTQVALVQIYNGKRKRHETLAIKRTCSPTCTIKIYMQAEDFEAYINEEIKMLKKRKIK